ncbi:MAG: hypothetical protein IPO41_07195 [Acidobacteria bacterium]|nr:hypothetical protein [Acidobacteriota bacterium]
MSWKQLVVVSGSYIDAVCLGLFSEGTSVFRGYKVRIEKFGKVTVNLSAESAKCSYVPHNLRA